MVPSLGQLPGGGRGTSHLQGNLLPPHSGRCLFLELRPAPSSLGWLYQWWGSSNLSNLLGPWRISGSFQGAETGAAHPLCSQDLCDKTPQRKMALVQKMWRSRLFLPLFLILNVFVPLIPLGRCEPKRLPEPPSSSLGIRREFGRGDVFINHWLLLFLLKGTQTLCPCVSLVFH